MKILLVTRVPALFEVLEKDDNEIPLIQPQQYWLRALRELNHNVEIFRYTDSPFFPNKAKARLELEIESRFAKYYYKWRLGLNQFYKYNFVNYLKSLELYTMINKLKPDLIYLVGGVSELVRFPFEVSKRKGIKILLFSGEDPNKSATFFERDNVDLFSLVVTNDSNHAVSWEEMGAGKALAVPYAGADLTIHKKIKLTDKEKRIYGCDVSFVGSLFKDRQKMLVRLLKNLEKFNEFKIDLRVFGYIPKGICLDEKLKPVYGGEVWGSEVVKAYNGAKIVLNFVPDHMKVGGNLRTFEIPASGAFQLANRCYKKWYKAGKEIELFANSNQLEDKILYYLKNEAKRKKIASLGFRKTINNHTYKKRFRQIIKLVS